MASETQVQADPSQAKFPQDEPVERRVTLLDLSLIVAQRKRFVFGIAFGFAGLVLCVCLIVPGRYSSEVDLLPPRTGNSASSLLSSQLGSALGEGAAATLGLKDPTDQYIDVLKSRTVGEGVIKDLNLSQLYNLHDPEAVLKKLRSRTKIEALRDGLITIKVQDRDAGKAAAIANAYVAQLQKKDKELLFSEASRRRIFFEQQMEAEKDVLADAEVDLKKTQMSTGVIQLQAQTNEAIRSVSDLRAQIASMRVHLQALLISETEQNPQVIETRGRLAALNEELAKVQKDPTDFAQTGNTALAPSAVPNASLDYVRKLREVKYHETLLNLLSRQYEAAKIDESKEAPQMQVIDAAVPAEKKTWPPTLLLTIAGWVIGFLGACVFIFAEESFQLLKLDPEAGPKIAGIKKAISGI